MIHLTSQDWLWATWRPYTPLPRPEPRPFDLPALLDQISKLKHSQDWWRLALKDLPPAITPAEAHFWLTFFDQTWKNIEVQQRTNPTQACEAIHFEKMEFDGKVEFAQVQGMFAVLSYHRLCPEMVILLNSLFPLAEQVDFYCNGDYWNSATLRPGFRRYVLPYLTEQDRSVVRERVRYSLEHLPVIPAYSHPFELWTCLYLAAAVGGMSTEIEFNLDKLHPTKWVTDDTHDDLAAVIFGLDNSAQVEHYIRQRECYFWRLPQVIGWLAHTETSALDWIVKSIQRLPSKTDAANMFSVLALVEDEAVIPAMLELQQQSSVGIQATKWLNEHPELAVRGAARAMFAGHSLAESYLKRLQLQGEVDHLRVAQNALEIDQWTEFQQRFMDAPLDTPFLTEENTPAWLTETLKLPAKKKTPPDWVTMADLPPLLINGCVLSPEQGKALLTALRASTLENPQPIVPALIAHLPANMLDVFAWGLFECWLARGGVYQEKWGLLMIGLLGGDASAMKLVPYIIRWPGEAQHKRAELGIDCLRAIGSDMALMLINRIGQKAQYKGPRIYARKAIEAIATARHLTQEQLSDRIVPDCGLDENGQRIFDYGSRQFTFVLTGALKPYIRDVDGKIKSDLPKPGARDNAALAEDAFATWKLIKKQIRETIKLETERLERALLGRRRWTVDEFESLLVQHPLMTHLVRRLLWGMYSLDGQMITPFRVTAERDYADVEDHSVTISQVGEIGLVHPIELTAQVIDQWNHVFTDYEIIPPFPQLARKVYAPLPEDLDAVDLTRFAHVQIETLNLAGLFSRLHWKPDSPAGAGVTTTFYKDFPAQQITALIMLVPGYPEYNPAAMGSDLQHIELCCFLRREDFGKVPDFHYTDQRRVKVRDLDALVISEILSDLIVMEGRRKMMS